MGLPKRSLDESSFEASEFPELVKYSIEEIVYCSAERTVYRAASRHDDSSVLVTLLTSLKLPRSIPLSDASNILRMRSSDIARFKHPHILPVIDAGEYQGTPFVVHGYTPGTRLSSLINTHGALSPQQAVSTLVRVAIAIDAAHSSNVYHGALRSESILIDGNGNAHMADFGIEYILQPLMAIRSGGDDRELAALLSYQAPERLGGVRLDRRGDLYSLAAIAFEALTGKRVVSGDASFEVRDAIRAHRLRSVTELTSSLPEEIDPLFEKALAQDPKQRFESAHEFVTALSRQLGISALGGRNSARTGSPTGEARNRTSGSTRPTGAGAYSFRAMDSDPEPVRIRKPGASFSHVREQLRPAISFIPRNPLYFWGGCALLSVSCICGWVLLSISSNPAQAVQIASPELSESPVPTVEVSGFEELEAPRVLPAPPSTPAMALQDREVLGILWENSASEARMIEALEEAQSRRLMELVNAAVKTLGNGSAAVRAKTARAVGALGDKRIVPYLMELLEDGDPLVRREAARSIGMLGERKAQSFLSTRYIMEGAPEVKAELRRAIDAVSGYPVSEAEISGFAH